MPDRREQDKSGNPQAGLVVDTGICHPVYVQQALLSIVHSQMPTFSSPPSPLCTYPADSLALNLSVLLPPQRVRLLPSLARRAQGHVQGRLLPRAARREYVPPHPPHHPPPPTTGPPSVHPIYIPSLTLPLLLARQATSRWTRCSRSRTTCATTTPAARGPSPWCRPSTTHTSPPSARRSSVREQHVKVICGSGDGPE